MKSWIASHFKVGTQSGDEWAVCCPLHDDKNPSASVNLSKGVFNCHKCGGMSLAKLADAMFWDAPPSEKQYQRKAQMQEVARYDYRDESGKLLYQQVRFLMENGEKSFRGYNPDTKLWKLEGVRRVPYRLPELLKAIESKQHVFICEGEKDVETLVEWGFCATTNSNGAKSTKQWHEFARYFPAACHVFICPDADTVGMHHAETIKGILDKKQCRVRILSFGYPVSESHGKDVTDWKAEGHTREDLINLIGDCAEHQAESDIEQPEKENDYGHACMLAPFFIGRFRYALHRKCWMEYTGKVWEPINDEKLCCLAAEYLIQVYFERVQTAMQDYDKEMLKKAMFAWRESQKYHKIQGAVNFLKGWPGLLTQYWEWDQHPWLLNCKSGLIDLHDGTLTDHDADKLITQFAPVDYDATAEAGLWNSHLEKFLPSIDVRREVQRNLGLSLCGAQNAEIFPIWYGTGANGKSTTIKAIQQVMGNYAIKAAADILIASKFDRHPAEIADLCGARLIFSVETDDQKRLAEAKVKELTGGDTLKARKMYGDFFQFEKTWTIFLLTNHKPIIRGTDHAIWRRVRLIPWSVKISDTDKLPQDEIVKYLKDESPAILNWLIEGLRDALDHPNWQAEEVRAATEDYRHDQDSLSAFFDECCEIVAHADVGTSDLYDAYCSHTENVGDKAFSQKTFSKCLKERDFVIATKRIDGIQKRCVEGIRLKGTELDF